MKSHPLTNDELYQQLHDAILVLRPRNVSNPPDGLSIAEKTLESARKLLTLLQVAFLTNVEGFKPQPTENSATTLRVPLMPDDLKAIEALAKSWGEDRLEIVLGRIVRDWLRNRD